MFDRDLANLYGVSTKALNQAVKRNIKRFPEDFMFRLTPKEEEMMRSQFVTASTNGLSDKRNIRNLSYVFTEQGVAMISSILKNDRAIEINIYIIRVFTKLRLVLDSHKKLADQIAKHDYQISQIFEFLNKLMIEEEKPKEKMGFSTD